MRVEPSGQAVGASEGEAVGPLVGLSVGGFEGAMVGDVVGPEVGEVEGALDGRCRHDRTIPHGKIPLHCMLT
jgi:outer membrane lipoprotein SlyB